MKVIDLLNKIANGEEIPKKIKYQCYEYVFNKEDKEYQRYFNGLNYGLGEDRRLDIILDDEVEILEEEKKIPEKLDIRQEKNINNNWKWKVYGKEHSYNISTPQKIIADKLNEIIDYLKSKGDE